MHEFWLKRQFAKCCHERFVIIVEWQSSGWLIVEFDGQFSYIGMFWLRLPKSWCKLPPTDLVSGTVESLKGWTVKVLYEYQKICLKSPLMFEKSKHLLFATNVVRKKCFWENCHLFSELLFERLPESEWICCWKVFLFIAKMFEKKRKTWLQLIFSGYKPVKILWLFEMNFLFSDVKSVKINFIWMCMLQVGVTNYMEELMFYI